MAEKLGIKMQTYANYEYGRRQPDFDILSKLAGLYEVTTDYLLGRDGKEENVPKIDKHAKLIAAHIDDDVSEEQMKQITDFIDFLKNKK
ncbi:hypothetical protein FC36_GL001885 [Ligilactobacillus equi DSM 15833 = JCM 10991]|uniref:HTH cro/C1-type domain-containing protein n=1 Tax=Ligilactobacillus equi DSM 15833 = JCM 10991 TaxID=1423740 RepID=A0A0R1TCZ7_9LACO|nr:hypothetical protein FC36_GL001885 [Ligilactobacillus equi DSM 15833 = JCM 10991]